MLGFMCHWWAYLSLNIIQFRNISMKNSYVITCNHGEKSLFQEPLHYEGPFLCDKGYNSLSDKMDNLMNLEYQLNVFSIN